MLIIDLACLYIKVNSCVYLQEANHAASIAFSVTPFQNQRHWILQYRHTKSGNCSVSLCKFILQIKAKSSWMTPTNISNNKMTRNNYHINYF